MTAPLTVAAVGDLQLGDSANCVGFGVASRLTRTGLAPALARVVKLFHGADVVFGNLETILSRSGLDASSWRSVQMRGDPAFAQDLRDAGFSIVNIANNHAVQHGLTAFAETVEYLTAAGIKVCGRRGATWCSEPVVLDMTARFRVGVLGYCMRPRQYGTGLAPYAEGGPREILDDVNRLRPSVDYLIVSLHWGEEFVSEPSTAEVTFAHGLVDAGACLVLGHHPHVVRPIERYRDGLIAYSLGNFVGDMIWQPQLRRGVVLRCEFAQSRVLNADAIQTYIDRAYALQSVPSDGGSVLLRSHVDGLPDGAYRRAAERGLWHQRVAAYRYALLNLWRYRPSMLRQLAAATLRNKLKALSR